MLCLNTLLISSSAKTIYFIIAFVVWISLIDFYIREIDHCKCSGYKRSLTLFKSVTFKPGDFERKNCLLLFCIPTTYPKPSM